MLNDPQLPHGNCYAVVPDKFQAGEYPIRAGAHDTRSKRRMERLLRYGVTSFVDLTREEDGLIPYESLAIATARKSGKKCTYRRFAIRDGDIPPNDDLTVRILDFIERSMEDDGCVYLHCWGGIGRTGTIVGCYLVRHGSSAEEALERVERFWRSEEKYDPYWTSPENELQKDYVRKWAGTD